MNASRLSFRQLLLGVAAGLLVGVGMTAWLGAAGREATAAAAAEQTAIVTLSALVDVVGQAQAAGGDVQDAVSRFAEGHPDLVWVRVVDLGKRRLVASTVAAETAAELPIRLERKNPDHKIWYDLGQSLRAAVDANRDQGRQWKDEITVERRDDGQLSLAAPFEREGKVSGVVLATAAAPPPALGTHLPGALGFLAVGVVVFLVVGWPLRGRGWLPAVAAGAIVLVVLGAYSAFMLGRLSADREAVESGVAERLVADAERFLGVIGAAGDLTAWDADRFRAPRGVLSADGRVAADRVAEGFAPTRIRFAKVFAVVAAFGLGLAAFVGLGGALHLGRTLVRYRQAYFYVTPALIAMLILVFFPFFFGITLSFTDQSLYNLNEPIYEIWVGFDNYVKILTDVNLVRETEGVRSLNYENFYWTLGFTIVWTVANVTIGVSLGLFLALLLNTKGLAFRPLYRVLLILPWAVPNYITALIWKGMFHQQFGVVNQFVQILGFEPLAWFDSPLPSFCTVLATNGWLSFPFMMVVSLGALQSIPADLYEAARVDGANRFQQFRLITLPSLKPALVPAVILSVVWTFNMFNIIFLVSEGQPGGATEILITRAFKLFYEQYQYGYAAAYATVIFGILLVYGTWQNRVTRAWEGV